MSCGFTAHSCGGHALLLTVPLAGAQAKIYAQWVQLGLDGAASARDPDAACPAVVFDGVSVAMGVRSARAAIRRRQAGGFPVRGCRWRCRPAR